MRPYAVYLHESVLQSTPRSGSRRDRIMKFIRQLGENPFQRGDYQDKDEAGNEIQVKIISDYAISYWPDHAVREIKIVNVQPAD
jgi:hypothetical protein